MCDKCFELAQEAQAQATVQALEAHANGEEVPESVGPMIPIVAIEMGEKVGLITSREGWEAIQKMMAVFGNIHELGD